MTDSWLEVMQQALTLLITFDADLWAIISVSFSVSLAALLITIVPCIAAGFLLAYARFPGRWLLSNLIYTMQTIPTVVIGLLVYLLLSHQGAWGDLRWLFTQKGMILGQILICAPILIAMSQAAFTSLDRRAWETARTLGANALSAIFMLLKELRIAILVAVVAAFSRILTEVGCSMMVGGNIAHHTRNIPTAIALETSKGDFAQAIALGMVLLFLSLIFTFSLGMLRGSTEPRSQ
ncbi:ABC transporter permease [Paraferrimonas haliotis]|uniref:ABC transporter permease n=1 Tax=Paraferrimonas haliotis TaxID=2013866 RepID=A0AA37WVK4_9GAMM|nr:ABC transporter permease [Paraferrimonas haliotis]GLS82157.1 ABC transporter permease [Paraferrimonas haliotis]